MPNGCSGGMDKLHKIFKGGTLSFTGCCNEHDLFYEQGGSYKDRLHADKLLRKCMKDNLQERGKSKFVTFHVPWIFYIVVRLFGWLFWSK